MATEVVRFAPQQKRQAELEPIDRAGHAVIALLQKAADTAEENIERAMTVAHRLSLELRTAEDRIRELEGEVERLESRATRAEQWLGAIKKEIDLLAHRSSEVIQAVAIVAMSVQPLCWLPLELVQQLLSEMPGQLGLGSLRKRGYIPYGGCG